MNHEKVCALNMHGQARADNANKPGMAAPPLGLCASELPRNELIKPVRSANAREQINAAIDQWAESLVAIIEASDNPQASLLRAHLAIATKHKQLEKLAWRELEIRQDATVPNG